MESKRIDELLAQDHIVVDSLPVQVPADSKGRFFAVEQYYLSEPQITQLHRRFLNVILKLYCYFPVTVIDADSDTEINSPDPEKLEKWIVDAPRDILIYIEGENSLITLSKDDIYMTVYAPSDCVLKLTEKIAASEGLFVR